MLSDVLCDHYFSLKRGWEDYKEDYGQEQNEEVEDILERIKTLLGKFDFHGYYIGSWRYDDGGHYQAHKLAVLEYRKQIYDAAGDLTEDWKGKEEAYKYPHWGNTQSERMSLAMSKLKSQGKLRWAQELREKTFKDLHKKLFNNQAKK